MASLTSLVATHGAVLLIDSASACVQVGLLRRGAGPVWRRSEQEAGIAIFECADAVMREAGLRVRDIGAFVFCEGPGSILGVRQAAMALRTWQAAAPDRPPTACAYRSLELVAHELLRTGAELPFAVITDARRDHWHCVTVSGPADAPAVRRVAALTLAQMAGVFFMPNGFRTWAPPPRSARTVSYSIAELWQRHGGTELLHAAAEPDALLHENPAYAAWSPQIHRASARSLS